MGTLWLVETTSSHTFIALIHIAKHESNRVLEQQSNRKLAEVECCQLDLTPLVSITKY